MCSTMLNNIKFKGDKYMKNTKANPVVAFRMDETLKKDMERTFNEMGMTISGAFTLFAKAVVRSGAIPFDIMVDPFYRKENQDEIERRIDLLETGKSEGQQVVMSLEELEEIVNDN